MTSNKPQRPDQENLCAPSATVSASMAFLVAAEQAKPGLLRWLCQVASLLVMQEEVQVNTTCTAVADVNHMLATWFHDFDEQVRTNSKKG